MKGLSWAAWGNSKCYHRRGRLQGRGLAEPGKDMGINQEVPTAIFTPAITCRVGERQALRSTGVRKRPRVLSPSVCNAHTLLRLHVLLGVSEKLALEMVLPRFRPKHICLSVDELASLAL